MSTVKRVSGLFLLLSVALLALPLTTATAEQSGPPTYKPEVKIFTPFTPNYDTSLKLIGPGHGLSFIEPDKSTSDPANHPDSDSNLGYCEDKNLTTSASDKPQTHSDGDASCK